MTMTTQDLSAVHSTLDDEAAVAILAEAVAISSVSGDERQLAERLGQIAAGYGAESFIDEVGNVHALVGRGSRTVMLLSHLDTVPGNVPFEHGASHIRGRGAVDAKGPLIAMLVAALSSPDLDLAIHWVGVVEEEALTSRGAEHVRTTVAVPQAVIVGEPSGATTVTVGYKGMVQLEVRCETPHTHTATPGLKSSELLIRALGRLLETFSTLGNADFAEIGMVVKNGRFEPFSSACSLSFRTPPGVTAEILRQRVCSILGAHIEVSTAYEVPAVVVPRTSACVRALSRAILSEGFKPSHNLKTGTSDMNTLSRSWDVPMVTYGPGDPHQDHTDSEYILIEEYLAGVRILRTALRELDSSLGQAS